MKIGIIGTGKIGSNLARLFVKAGPEVIISYSRSPEKLQALQKELGSKAKVGTVAEAVKYSSLTVLSIRFSVYQTKRGWQRMAQLLPYGKYNRQTPRP